MADNAVALPSHINVSNFSELQLERIAYHSVVPAVLSSPAGIIVTPGERTVARSSTDDGALRSWFPHTYPQPILNIRGGGVAPTGAAVRKGLRVGIVFCGRQCPGANNVVTGEAVAARNGNNSSDEGRFPVAWWSPCCAIFCIIAVRCSSTPSLVS